MARAITDFDGTVIPIGGAYPYGDIKDIPGGTIINSTSNSDMQQFFQRLMALAGVTPNGLPDNNTNTFQLWNAFYKFVNPPWTNSGVVFENDVPGSNVWDNAGGPYGKFHYRVVGDVNDGLVFFSGVVENSSIGSPASPLIMNLPAAIRPTYTTRAMAWEDLGGSGTPTPVQIEINTNGDVVPLSTGTGGTLVYFDGLCYRLGANTY